MNTELKKLIDICRKILEGKRQCIGDLETLTIDESTSEEIAQLAEYFNLLLLKLEINEHLLEKAINDLKETKAISTEKARSVQINIDVVKKAKTVEQITQTSFFKKLQARSKFRRSA